MHLIQKQIYYVVIFLHNKRNTNQTALKFVTLDIFLTLEGFP